MGKRINYKSGEIIGNLVYVKDDDGKSKNRRGIFICPYCKNKFSAIISNVKKKDHTNSCGCKTIDLLSIGASKHNKTKHPLYFVWHDIKNRCYNKKYKYFHRYGGRGISVCDEWKYDFSLFYEWSIANGWKKGLQIDRINNDGNYINSNCRFTTPKDNVRNSTATKMDVHSVMVLKRMIRRFRDKSDIELSKYFNVGRVAVYDIRIGKTWSDIKI